MTKASDHSKKMKALFGGVDPSKLGIGEETAPPKKPSESKRVSSGTVKSMTNAFSAIEHENEELRQKLERSEIVYELDPDLIDPSPYRDRFESDAEAEQALEDLKVSLSDEGQRIPVLVRPHPTEDGRYQLAYGHRRTAAVKALYAETERPETVRVRAYVREISDAELIKEQSLENTVRENLSWIELALWARQLKSTGITNRAMAPILGVPESGVSRMLSISDKVPEDVARSIGRAKGTGYRPWLTFADLLKDAKTEKRVRSILNDDEFRAADSNSRLTMAMNAAKGSAKKRKADKPKAFDLKSNGAVYGKVKQTAGTTTMTLPRNEIEFANWLTEKMNDLRSEFLEGLGKKPGR